MWILYGYIITLVVTVISSAPSKPPGACERARSKASGLLGAFVPKCKPDGSFEKKQCYASTGYCWCVDPTTGNEIKGSRKPLTEDLTCGDVIVTCASCPGQGSHLEGTVGENLIIRFYIKNTTYLYLLKIKYKESVIEVNLNTVNLNGVKDTRLSVPKPVHRDNTLTIDLRLKALSLELDNDAAFVYEFMNKTLDVSSDGKHSVFVKVPPAFCKAPEKTYAVEAGQKHGIEFSVCGNPKPTKVTAKVGLADVPVADVDSRNTSRYMYNYRADITMQKEQCGDNLKIVAQSFRNKSFDSNIKLLFQPGNVQNVSAHRDEMNFLTVSWGKVQKFGRCHITYHIKRTHNGITEVHGTSLLTYKFKNANGNNSISVYAEINGRKGASSDPIYIDDEIPVPTTSPVIGGKDGGLAFEYVAAIVVAILLIVGLLVAVVIIKMRKQRKERYDSDRNPLDEAAPEEYVDVNNFMDKQCHQQDKVSLQQDYAELGPGGEDRASQKSVSKKAASSHAASKTGDGYPESQRSYQKPVVGSDSSRSSKSRSNSKSKPSVSSLSNQHEDSSFDYESSVMI